MTILINILHVFLVPVVLYIMYKTEFIYKITFYMKFMTVSCSMSKFLPIVIIFRQIFISPFHISLCIYLLHVQTCHPHVGLLNLSNMFSLFYHHGIHIFTSGYFTIIYIFLNRICNHSILFQFIPFFIQFIYILYNL